MMRRIARLFSWCAALLLLFGAAFLFGVSYFRGAGFVRFGATYSVKYARELGMDPLRAYRKLSAIGIRDWRIPVYWDIVEKREGAYDFRLYDAILRDAERNGSRVILVLGRRVPRWPECHVPEWAKHMRQSANSPAQIAAPFNGASKALSAQDEAIKKFVAKTVKRYRNNRAIIMWQIENEPLLKVFGDRTQWHCPPYDAAFFRDLVEIVRENDPSGTRPVITTESGELGFWFTPSRIEMLRVVEGIGFSFYRRAWTTWGLSSKYREYPRYPVFYRLKAWAYRLIAPHLFVFLSELQAEPWGSKPMVQMEISELRAALPPQTLREIIHDSKRTGFDRIYFWGVESALYLEHRGYSEYWDIMREVFQTK